MGICLSTWPCVELVTCPGCDPALTSYDPQCRRKRVWKLEGWTVTHTSMFLTQHGLCCLGLDQGGFNCNTTRDIVLCFSTWRKCIATVLQKNGIREKRVSFNFNCKYFHMKLRNQHVFLCEISWKHDVFHVLMWLWSQFILFGFLEWQQCTSKNTDNKFVDGAQWL